ncbi:MAG: hypothetical protein IPK83_21070 [Planctomycetes bacterium]|nr:hypothetical protein [Planctomycetota bacterium]
MRVFKYIWRLLVDFDARLRRRFERTAVRLLHDHLKNGTIEVEQQIKVLHGYCELKKQNIAELKTLVDLFQADAQCAAKRPRKLAKGQARAHLAEVIENVYGEDALVKPVPRNGAPELQPGESDSVAVS